MGERIVVYPAYITPDNEGKYLVSVPDLNIDTFGTDFANAIYMARDAIGLMCATEEDEGKTLPEAGMVNAELEDNTIKTYVDVDLIEYRKKILNKTVRKNVSIPYYLSVEADKLGLNCSRLLQEAIQEKIYCM